MFNMSPEKFSEIAEDLDPVKPLNVNKLNYFTNYLRMIEWQPKLSGLLSECILQLFQFTPLPPSKIFLDPPLQLWYR